MIVDRIQELCDKKGTNITALCKEITGSSGNLPTWKKGNIRTDYLSKIADYFDVSTDYLLGKTDIPKVQNIVVTDKNGNQMALDDETLEYIDSLRTRPEMRVLFSVTNKATKEDIIKAVKIIEALKNESE